HPRGDSLLTCALCLARCGFHGVFRRDSGVLLTVLLCLGAELHETGGDGSHIPPALRREHRPEEIGAADVGAGLSVIEWRSLQAAFIVRPSPSDAQRNSKGR